MKDVLTRKMAEKGEGVEIEVTLKYDSDEPIYEVARQCKKLLTWVADGQQLDLDLPEAGSNLVVGAELRVDQPGTLQKIGSIGLDFALGDSNVEAMKNLFTRMERGERFNVVFKSLGPIATGDPADIEEEVEEEAAREAETA